MTFLVESRQKNNVSEIVVFRRDSDNNKIVDVVSDFRPYFYVNESETVPDDYKITGIEHGFKSLMGQDVKKIFVKQSIDVYDLKTLFTETYEADIPFNQRYLIDVIGEVPPYELRVFGFDIETTDEGGFPDTETADKCITAISFKDSFTKDKIKMLYKHPDCTIDIKEDKNTFVFDTEEAMLTRFVKFVNEYDPDIITGWNVKDFDLTYLIRRMDGFRLDYSVMSPMGHVRIDSNYKDTIIKGRLVMDMMECYKHFRKISNQGQAEAYSLEFTAQQVLGTGKLSHKESFHEMWLNKPNELLEYNMRDVELVMQINDELKIIDFFSTICCKACTNMDRIFHTSVLVDGLLLRKTSGKQVLPSKKNNDGDKFSGAHVLEPVPGLYDNVLALDIKGMYPNLIKSFNISYETFNPNGNIKLTDELGFDSGCGLIPQTIMDLEIERNGYKKLMFKAIRNKKEKDRLMYHFRQYAVKVLANCFSHDTNVLTPTGERNIKDLKKGDEVFSIEPNTKQLQTKKVTRTYEYDYTGEMCHFKTQNMDLMVTPNHNMLATTPSDKRGFFVNAEYWKTSYTIPKHNSRTQILSKYISLFANVNVNDYVFFIKKNVDLRTLKQKIKKAVPNTDYKFKKINKTLCKVICTEDELKKLFLHGFNVFVKYRHYNNSYLVKPYIENSLFSKLLGWFISEGSSYVSKPKQYDNGNYRGISKKITISQDEAHNPLYYKEIEDLLKKLELRYYKNKNGFAISSPIWFDNLIKCGKNSYEKHVHTSFTDVIDYELFFECLYKGDGHKNLNKYTTVSEKLKNQLLIILTNLGCRVRWKKDQHFFRIIFDKCNWKPHKKNITRTKNNSGKVYCVEVEDNHTLLAGRNNKYCWCGQSIYGYLGFPKSRLYKPEVAESVTIMGRKLLKHTKQVLEDKTYQVIYGDTDSVYVQSKETSLFKLLSEGKTLVNLINESYIKFVNEHGSDNCTLEMEFEKVFKRILFVEKRNSGEGAKKKYAYLLLWADGKPVSDKVEFTGFDTVRSDVPRISRMVQETVLNMVLNGSDKHEVTDFLMDIEKKIRNKEISDEEIGFPKGISKELKEYGITVKGEDGKTRKTGSPPIVTGARYCNKFLGARFGKGSKPKWIYVKSVPKGYPLTKIIAFDEFIPEGFKIDYKLMYDRIFKAKLEEIFKACGFGQFPEMDASVKTLSVWFGG